jgi:Uma2 family endonuclease
MTPALDALLEAPTLPEAIAVLTRRLKEEQQRREKFYEEMTPDMKAEFINGEVIMHSPALARHTEARLHLTKLLHTHVMVNNLGIVHDEKTLCVFPRNDYEPDVVFFGLDKSAQITPDTLKFPVPDFACEVLSESTEKRDRGIKFQDYEAHEVREYWIIDPVAETVEQYVLAGTGTYELRVKSGTGEIASTVIPSFTIPIKALFDAQSNLAVLRQILN